MQLLGLHHVTAVSARIRDNHHFYTRVLGMRLVKRSVNQDDVSAYHLFYADALGTPGSDLTFFDWPVPASGAAPGRSPARRCARPAARSTTGPRACASTACAPPNPPSATAA
jgi:glyoxalase family protein